MLGVTKKIRCNTPQDSCNPVYRAGEGLFPAKLIALNIYILGGPDNSGTCMFTVYMGCWVQLA